MTTVTPLAATSGAPPALQFLADQPLALLFLLFAIGSLLGGISIKGVRVGPAAVLFTAIGLGTIASANGMELEISEHVGMLGLVMFTYTIGVMSGPTFFSVIRSGWPAMLTVFVGLLVCAGVAVALGSVFDMSPTTIGGTFAGAVTNTPALAAVGAASGTPGGAASAAVGYSISYVWGVFGMLLGTMWALRKYQSTAAGAALTNATIEVERSDTPLVRDLVANSGGSIAVSRIKHAATGTVRVADGDDRLKTGDLVTVVGPYEDVTKTVEDLGHQSTQTLVTDRKELDFRRITLSNHDLAGRTLGQLNLHGRFGAIVTRVRRGDTDMVASAHLVLNPGDRLRVIAPANRMAAVSSYLGDSTRGLADINPFGLALGMVLGVLIGAIQVPVGSMSLSLGAAGGTLIMGLIFGRIGRIGPVVTTFADTAGNALSSFGMLAFLAYAGTKAGGHFSEAITSDLGWKVALVGFVTTSLFVVILITSGRILRRREVAARKAGILGGAQTQPAILAFANDRTNFDPKVGLGYAMVYPTAMIVKILIGRFLGGM